jgi:phosphatidylserine/phosphatidylglycerophosphate/cardiolipin synthase-like enzyme
MRMLILHILKNGRFRTTAVVGLGVLSIAFTASRLGVFDTYYEVTEFQGAPAYHPQGELPNLTGKFNDTAARTLASDSASQANTSATSPATSPANPRQRTIVVLYSDTGGGHLAAAKAVQDSIKKQDPEANVVIKNIWEFSNEWVVKAKHKAWSMTLHNFPALRDIGYQNAMKNGNKAEDLADIKQYHRLFSKDKAYDYLAKMRPDAVIATNYSGAEILRVLRQEGNLANTKVGWVVTDYAEGYWPRVSKFFDKTFLPHPAMQSVWESRGVSADKLSITGLPLNPYVFVPADRKDVFEKAGFDPKVRTIVITGGSDGAAPYKQIIQDIAKSSKEPLQVVAICGRNKTAEAELNALKESLKPKVSLHVSGFTPAVELLDWVKTSDLYISKAGGLSPSEGFAIGKPMVVYNAPGGGVEYANTDFIKDKELALVTRDGSEIGKLAVNLLNDPKTQKRMLEAQKVFKDGLTLQPIVDFAEGGRKISPPKAERLLASAAEEDFSNRGLFLITEKDALDARIQLIQEATENIDFNTYIWRTDDVGKLQLKLLRDAARRGVKVRVVLDSQGGRKISPAIVKHLQDEGIEFKLYHPQRLFKDPANFHRRMHDKYVSADGRRAILGGRNAQNSYYGITPKKNWHNFTDFETYLEGPDVASGDQYFDELFNGKNVEHVPGVDTVTTAEVRKAANMLNAVDIDILHAPRNNSILSTAEKVGKFEIKGSPHHEVMADLTEGITQDIFKMMRRVEKELVVVTPYLILTDEMKQEILDLRKRDKHAVFVTNSLSSNDNKFVQASYRRDLLWLESHGVEVHEYQGPLMLHTKLFYRDGGIEAFNGSFNWDPRSQRLNSEMGAIIKTQNSGDGSLAKKLIAYTQAVMKNSVPVTGPKRIRPRSWWGCARDTLLQVIVTPKAVREFL